MSVDDFEQVIPAAGGGGPVGDADTLEGEGGAHYLDRDNHTGTQFAASISDLPEAVQDLVGAMATEGANIDLTYDDSAGTLTIAATGLAETVQDIVGAMATAGANTSVTYDDGAGTLAIAVTGLTETVQDLVGAMATAGANIDLTYDDSAGTLTIAAAGLTETVQDIVGAFASGTGGVTVTYNDGAGTLVATIADGALSLAKLANIANFRILGNVSGGSAAPAELTPTQMQTLRNTIAFQLPTVAPVAPAAVGLHSEKRARDFPYFTGPNGASLTIGDAMWARTWVLVSPGATTALRTQGTTQGAISTSGTISHLSAGTTALGVLANVVSAASTNAQASVRTSGPFVFRGASSDVYAGFEAHARVRFPDASYNNTGAATGTRLVGLALYGTSGATLFGGDRGGTQDLVGFMRSHVNGGATDTNWQLVTCDNTTTSVADTGMAFTVGNVYEFTLWCPAGGTAIEWHVQNVTAGTVQSGSVATNLPRTTTGLDSATGLQTIDAVGRNFGFGRVSLSSDKG